MKAARQTTTKGRDDMEFYIVAIISFLIALFYPISSLLNGGSTHQLGGPFIFIGIY